MNKVYSEAQIAQMAASLSARLSEDYAGRTPLLIGVLTGAFIFMADLVRGLDIECELDFVRMESYGDSTVSSGQVTKSLGSKIDPAGRDVIIVEEIVDTGLTVKALVAELEAAGAKSVAICSLVDKRSRREVELTVDYPGFVLDDGFLVGYGLDHAEKLRNLAAIYVMDD